MNMETVQLVPFFHDRKNDHRACVVIFFFFQDRDKKKKKKRDR